MANWTTIIRHVEGQPLKVYIVRDDPPPARMRVSPIPAEIAAVMDAVAATIKTRKASEVTR